MSIKQNFKQNEHVIIHSFKDDGKEYDGMICGKSIPSNEYPEHYIVRINPNEFDGDYECISVSEACLKRY